MSTRPDGQARRYEREIRSVLIGGLVFLMFLIGVLLVVLRNTEEWGRREALERVSAEAAAVASRLAPAADPGAVLAADAEVASRLARAGALHAALYAREGERRAVAAYLPEATLAPGALAGEEASPGARAEESAGGRSTIRVVVAPDGADWILAVGFDGAALAKARRNVATLTWVVPAASLALLLLAIPFLRRLVQPIEALAETARDARAVVRREDSATPDEPAQALATFARTIEELKSRTAELEALREREAVAARRELAALSEMSAGIAHEFRNATATILGYTRLAGEDEDASTRRRHLAAIQAEAQHVARITGDFLFFASPERLSAETAELGLLVDEILSEEQLAAPEVRFTKEGEFGASRVDVQLLRRALVNLLRNAREAARERVLVRGEVSEGFVRLAVEDDGRGVPPDLVPKVFVPFFSTKDTGTGLGLALVARIAALHGGAATVERSAALGGARFVVTLPAQRS